MGALSLKGNVKRYGGFPSLFVQPKKNCVHPPTEGVLDAASLFVESSTLILKRSPIVPLLQDAQSK